MKVTIVGAGVMGLSTAWGLARRGHQVTLYDQGPVPNPAGSSVDQHRLIRYPYGAEAGYTRMVAEAYAAWDALWRDLGETLYVPTGTLVLATAGPTWADDSAAVLASRGHSIVWLEPAEVEARYPALSAAGIRRAFAVDTGGALLAGRIVAALAAHLERLGVRIVPGATVAAVDPGRARVRLDGGATHEADALVIAAGAWVTRLLPQMAARVTPSRQLVVYLEPPSDLASFWRRAPMVLDIDPETGFYLVPPVGDTGLKVGDHRFTRAGDPDGPRDAAPGEVESVVEACRRRLRGLDRYRIAGSRVCFYTVEPQERFILEPLERAWVVSACSGHAFKFGAVLGLALAETLDGRRAPAELSRWAAGQAC